MEPGEIAKISLFAALTAVGAMISIPIGPVPITLQVLFVLLSGLLLGPRLGFLSQVLYLTIGAMGFPVFSRFSGGVAVLYGPTTGYLWAFPLAALVAGLLRKRTGLALAGSLIGVGVIYLLGWFRLSLLIGEARAFEVGVLPFVPFDALKAIAAVWIAKEVRALLPEDAL
ncbi:biotin transporter BioY [Thermococcus zilligii]|uniref:biotin transporter BioY n=1 Tax=Thermococcus zilligii TaxID=54076 RepID=UPI00029A7B74|nr:biotin transporter BioY [Thermococcus zilligii]